MASREMNTTGATRRNNLVMRLFSYQEKSAMVRLSIPIKKLFQVSIDEALPLGPDWEIGRLTPTPTVAAVYPPKKIP